MLRRSAHPSEIDLSAYLDGELAAARLREIELHIATCSECAEALDGLRQTKSLVATVGRLQPRRVLLFPESEPVRARSQPRALVFAPAVALSLLVALVLVDVGLSGTSQDASETLMAGRAEDTGATKSSAGAGADAVTRSSNDAAAESARPSVLASPAPSIGNTQNVPPVAPQPSVPQPSVPQPAAPPSTAPAQGAPQPSTAAAPSILSAPTGVPPTGGAGGAVPQPATAPGVIPAPLTPQAALAQPYAPTPASAAAAVPSSQESAANTPPGLAPVGQTNVAIDNEGTSLLRVLQIIVAAVFVGSLLALVWSKLVNRGVT